MDKKVSNPPAFPSHASLGNLSTGMTLRDAFVIAVIPALIIASKDANNISCDDVIGEAGKYADAMLLEREKTN